MTSGVALEEERPEASARFPRYPVLLRALALVGVLFVFFVSINLMGDALRKLTESYVAEILAQATENPVVGLLLGILATSIIQSSSATTSIVVAFAAAGAISLGAAIPMVMGANIGTTVTNTIVSFAHVRRQREFQKALAAGTVHDFFNILVTFVLFPLEVSTGFLQKSALWLKDAVLGQSFGKVSGLKVVIKPIVKTLSELLHYPGISLVLALIVLFVSLTLMVRLMRSLFISRMARALDRFLFRNAISAILVGTFFTILVQSSSVTTSLVVPLVGAGILTLEQIFPYTLGANIGTTVTAFLAALALASTAGPDQQEVAGVGVTVAVVHLLFNVFGIILIYPFKAIPIWLARWMARVMSQSRKRILLFLLVYFLLHIAPLAMFLFV
jgi:sodium-dependent phosphate cotransporter